MKDNKTILVTLVFLLVAVLIFFNFEKFTGQATKTDMTNLYVSSKEAVMSESNPVVGKGKYIYFSQIPGTEGGSGTLYIREMEKGRKWGKIVRTQEFDNCNSRKCNYGVVGDLKFTTYYDWEGQYCGEIKDLATWEKVTTCFTVK
ncbi:MAG: hypothetical protein ISS23_00225 [Nanoarchaeota archaeon]|nr:hypothetical protein [Nanoarchaeota archaeon]